MKVLFRDRHAEHIDQDIPLCDHGEFTLYPGDKFVTQIEIGGAVLAEVELLLEKKSITLTINQLDYLIEQARRGLRDL